MGRFLEYWQCGFQQQILHALTPEQVQGYWQILSRAECRNGKITNTTLLKNLLFDGNSMVIIPHYSKLQEQYFFPYMLLAELNGNGEFVVKPHLSLPIIPHSVLEPGAAGAISLGANEDFDNYVAIHPPIWLDDHSTLSWRWQLAYADQMLAEVNTHWHDDLAQLNFIVQEDALIFPLQKLQRNSGVFLQADNLEILEESNKITLIDAERNSGKSTHAKQLILNAWIEAAVKQCAPPKYVWVEPDKSVTYANIFACLGVSDNSPIAEDVHDKLVAVHDIYLQGQQTVRYWQEAISRITKKYADKGGVNARLQQLQQNLKEINIQSKHLQVLHSIWVRQIELLTKWPKMLNLIPLLQKQRLQRLHLFFKQNFPADIVEGFTEDQFKDAMQDKVRRIDNSERIIADALHQAENDLYQETLVREKCLQWCQTQQLDLHTIDEIQTAIQDKVWQNVVKTAVQYWQQDFTAKQGHANFLNAVPNEIDVLIVEHAEYISPMQAASLLSISKRAIIMGNYNPICNPRFAVHIDYELTKHFGLVENDADFEDLQFEGKLAALGNMWNMVAQGQEADEIFSSLAATDAKPDLQYEFVDVSTPTSLQYGSIVNHQIIPIVVDWLTQHAAMKSEIAIYTCTSGQIKWLRNALITSIFAKIPIRAIQDPCFVKSAISIFVPVYTKQDPGPFPFDRGTEMLDQLIANTQSRLVVIGDKSIFKPELHSASGKFAKLLFANNNTNIEEVVY